MHKLLVVVWQAKLHHQLTALYVQATCGNVSTYQNVQASVTEHCQSVVALLLTHLTVQNCRLETVIVTQVGGSAV